MQQNYGPKFQDYVRNRYNLEVRKKEFIES